MPNNLHQLHCRELVEIWKNDKRIPSVDSRRRWAAARNLKPERVHAWFSIKKNKLSPSERPTETYELDVGTPPELSTVVVKQEPKPESLDLLDNSSLPPSSPPIGFLQTPILSTSSPVFSSLDSYSDATLVNTTHSRASTPSPPEKRAYIQQKQHTTLPAAGSQPSCSCALCDEKTPAKPGQFYFTVYHRFLTFFSAVTPVNELTESELLELYHSQAFPPTDRRPLTTTYDPILRELSAHSFEIHSPHDHTTEGFIVCDANVYTSRGHLLGTQAELSMSDPHIALLSDIADNLQQSFMSYEIPNMQFMPYVERYIPRYGWQDLSPASPVLSS